eukprot:m.192131 g.192131  ORF g.192131 m.192131 type:complete len:74 (-) comp21731_c3_seq1:264-485(-)
MPEVKLFVKERAQQYNNVKVTYIAGANPVAHFYDAAGVEQEKLDLSGMTTAQIEAAFEERGFTKKSTQENSDL